MIYEYPEDFVVPITYVRDLNPMHRDWEFKYMKVEELLIPHEQLQEDKKFHMNEYKNSKDVVINFLDVEEDSLQEPYQDDMFNDKLDGKYCNNDNIKGILNDIDNDYANSETLRI